MEDFACGVVCAGLCTGDGLRNTLGTYAVAYSPSMGSAKSQLVAGTQGLVRTRKKREKMKRKPLGTAGAKERGGKALGVKVSTTSLMELPSRARLVVTSPLRHAAASAMLAEEEDASQTLAPSNFPLGQLGGGNGGQWGCGDGV